MQVNQVTDHVTHAVIGGKKSAGFSISDSAEFFQILSSTLYTNQKLAVVREVLCNAWDAHIEAGCTDRPIEITLDDNSLIVRDYGKGIHDDNIVPIYCVYGESTKKCDGNQTGGFGLGCKAPFAYTDHFEVTSHHQGIRTIYKMSKSNAEAMGKPGVTPIVSFPTKESGLQVKIDVLNSDDTHAFEKYIKRVVLNGEIKATLNGVELERLTFSDAPHKFVITNRSGLIDGDHQFMLRYGNVIYPIPRHDEYYGQLNALANHLNSLRTHSYHYKSDINRWKIILLAEPDTISVTPSRESLSMQDHTISTISKLMSQALSVYHDGIQKHCATILKSSIDELLSKENLGVLLTRTRGIPLKKEESDKQVYEIKTLREAATQYMKHNYPDSSKFFNEDLAYRLRKMVEHGMLDRGLTQTLLSKYEKEKRTHVGNWFQKRILGPLFSAVRSDARVSEDKLYVFDNDVISRFIPIGNEPIYPAKHVRIHAFASSASYLRKLVVVTHARKNIFDRLKKVPEWIDGAYGTHLGMFIYHTPRNNKIPLEDIISFFKEQGYTVFQLPEEEIKYVSPIEKEAKKRKAHIAKQGLPILSAALKGNTIEHKHYRDDETVPRVENPEVVVRLERSFGQKQVIYTIAGMSRGVSKELIRLFGNRCGIAASVVQEQSYIDKGAMPFEKFLEQEFTKKLGDEETLNRLFSVSLKRIETIIKNRTKCSDYRRGCLEHILSSKVLIDHLGLGNEISVEEYTYMSMFDDLRNYGSNRAWVTELHRRIGAVKTSSKVGKFVARFLRCKNLSLLDMKEFNVAMKKANPKQRQQLLKIFDTAFYG